MGTPRWLDGGKLVPADDVGHPNNLCILRGIKAATESEMAPCLWEAWGIISDGPVRIRELGV